MTRGAPEYQVLEHTADVGILVRAPDAPSLFERCAGAMFDLMADVTAVAADMARGAAVEEVHVEAPDREALLVAWLGELLGRAVIGDVIYAAFDVTALTPTRLAARVWGAPVSAAGAFRAEIKAVTYHELLVSEDREGWAARIIFDI